MVIFLFLYSPLSAQKKITYDSSNIEVRHLPYSKIKSYSDQKDFDYRENSVKAESLWDRFWVWFWEQFYRMSRKESVQKGFEIFIWIFSISLILFAVYRLTGMERRFFFQGSGNARTLQYSEEQEDIHSIDFDKAIQDAIDNQQYRFAIRLMYLKNIRILSDRNLIQFRPNKTNFDYARELTFSDYSKGFEEITLVYEYAWYGEFPVDKGRLNNCGYIFPTMKKPYAHEMDALVYWFNYSDDFGICLPCTKNLWPLTERTLSNKTKYLGTYVIYMS
jgi:hypothetical protein